MDARSKRREATRRQLEQQLRERQAREARRKRVTLISSIVGTVVVIALVVVLVVVLAGNNDSKKPKAGSSGAASSPASTAAPTKAPTKALAAPVACTPPTGKATASYKGVTVANAINLKKDPKLKAASSTTAPALACDDLVVGKGAAAKPGATVTVQYSGVLYRNGTQFDSSWARGMPASFALKTGAGGVIPGFSEGIGGTGKVAPMRIGGRRIIIMPSQLAYGTAGSGSVPANADLVFVVDLTKVS